MGRRPKRTGYAPSTLKRRLEAQLREVRNMGEDGRMDEDFAIAVEVGLAMALRAWDAQAG